MTVASQKNRLLAVVLIMTGCSQATLRDGEGRGVFIDVLKNSLASENIEVRHFFTNIIIEKARSMFVYNIVGCHCPPMSSQLYQPSRKEE